MSAIVIPTPTLPSFRLWSDKVLRRRRPIPSSASSERTLVVVGFGFRRRAVLCVFNEHVHNVVIIMLVISGQDDVPVPVQVEWEGFNRNLQTA